MALSREEIDEIASKVARRVVAKSGLNCSCHDIEPVFLRWIEDEIPKLPEGIRKDLSFKLGNIAKACGYEKQPTGLWVQFPKQDAVLEKIGPYTTVHEHDDGDLTLDTRNWGKVVVTTEGEVFYAKGAGT